MIFNVPNKANFRLCSISLLHAWVLSPISFAFSLSCLGIVPRAPIKIEMILYV